MRSIMRSLSISLHLQRHDLGHAQARPIGDAERGLVLDAGAASKKRATSSGLRMTGILRGSRDERQMSETVGPIERNGEEKPQRRNRSR